ncbi:L-threonylcarbamoyladenylate synthase [Marinoscillum furvescens]|uniref:Threonylcarbamoyl-AMP synthase n=1 Tax=Marinoscillum furvescens DSM 4134 TaxID=1122208 RepID=A0A3D9L1S2_MARFU|nr:L-threonylcarbamoyladenylate synthase [Marinoscillum furvescens]RED97047.1 translation factor SUA5 [Marinoscillum furvescens DSM 4134]
MAEIGTNIADAVTLLREGKLVAMPTETVYGLAGNALNEAAILDIFKVKNRPKFDPLIAHTNSLEKVKAIVSHLPYKAQQLAEAFWPGPLTMLLEKKSHIPDLLTSGLPTVAVRIPKHPVALELLGELDFPLAAPSANPFGYVSPTTAHHVDKQLGSKIPYILDGGECSIGIESTIVGFDENEEAIVYRLGGKQIEDIEAVVGSVHIQVNHSSDPMAPGMLKSHYAPGKTLRIGDLENLMAEHSNETYGVISYQRQFEHLDADRQITLSPSGNLDEAARNLFGALRSMDERGVSIILTEKFPDIGLGRAINDRLKRASVR